MSRKVKINPYTGETLKEPLIVYEDQPLTPEMFYGLETIKTPSMNCSALEGIDTALKLANKLEFIAEAAVHNEGKETRDCLMHIVDVLRSAHLKEGKDSTAGNDSVIDETTKKAVKHWLEIGKKAEKVWYDEAQKNDMVNHPHHYQSYNPELQIECIDAMRAAYGDEDVKSFCLCNALKYLFRCYSKGRNEDIKKAQWYLDKFMELGGMNNE